MADKARKKTDQELKKLEREIYELYATSSSDMYDKWNKYMQSHKKKLNALHDKLEKAESSGNRDDIRNAKDDYERAVKNVTLNDNRYKVMINETTSRMAHVNEIALSYVNNDVPKIYTLNYNAFADEKIDGYDFTLINERAVKNLFESNKIGLPPKKLDIPKDKAWNTKNLNSQLMQGILQGESIPKIAKRLQNVTDMNRNSAIRNARTMVTGAENKGRQDSFKKATDDGVLMEREWIAAHDGRTRAWHKALHGETVGVDEPFVNDYGEIMYPGDPDADPLNVYNCRCSIRAIVQGFAWTQTSEESSSAKYVEEIKDDADEVKKDPFYDLDSVAVNEFKSGIDTVLSDFNISADRIKYDRHKGDDLFAQVYSEDGKTNIFLSDLYKDYDDVYRLLSKNPYDGISTSMPIFFNGIHEAGHILEFELSPYGLHSSEMFSREIVQGAQRDVRKLGLSASKSSISNYAAVDNHEAIAEAIVDYYLNGGNATPLSVAIYKRLRKYIK